MHVPHKQMRTQGIALVAVLLSAMVLMIALLGISATMTISSQRTTADQGVTLQAQYAAEAGLARANVRLNEAQTLMNRLNVINSTRTQIEAHASNYCNVSSLNSLPTPTPPDSVLCEAANPSGSEPSSRYSLFTSYPLTPEPVTNNTAYPSSLTAAQYWSSIFSRTPTSTKIATDPANGSESWYTLTYGLTPKRVLRRTRNFYRFEFTVAPTISMGEVRAGGQAVTSRRVQQETSGSYFFDVQLPSFARNFVFRDETTSTAGGQLFFAGGETFNGPVHTNKTPGFLKTSGVTPVFTNDFSSCASSGAYSGYSGSTTSMMSPDMQNTFRGSDPEFSLDPCIRLPTNSNNQKRASFGGDPTNVSSVTEQELQTAWNLSYTTTTPPTGSFIFCLLNPSHSTCRSQTVAAPLPSGVYYSKGDGSTTPNQAASWNNDTTTNIGGGVYIKGDVDQLKLCTNGGWQLISVKQGSTTTTFAENANGTWTVSVKTDNTLSNCNGSNNGTAVKTLNGTFNGMIYADGDINEMRGDGTNTADIASSNKLMVTSTGKVLLKDNITYTDIPSENNRTVVNVLGIYSSGEKCEPVASSSTSCGSILADGANNKDLDIHASIMATKEITGQDARKGEGFGAARNSVNLGLVSGRKARINLLGGVIERQSQTVSSGSANGYDRAYNYDVRFADGYAPPFFPEQAEGGESAVIARWTSGASPFGTQQGVWQTVGN